MVQRTLFYGDNLQVMREKMHDLRGKIDLIYLDPPFNSEASYNIIYRDVTGNPVPEQTLAFADTWELDAEDEAAIQNMPLQMERQGIDELFIQLWKFWTGALKGTNSGLLAYLVYMVERLLVMKPLLKPTGSIYLHCDPTASHYIKIMMDAIFGQGNFRNEVVWKRTSAHSSARRWGPIHDTILFYTMGEGYTWNEEVQQKLDSDYVSEFYKYEDERGRYRVGDLTAPGKRAGESGLSWRGINPTEKGRHWAVPEKGLPPWFHPKHGKTDSTQDRLDILDAQGLVHWPKKAGGIPAFKRYLSPNAGMAVQDIITDIPPLGAHAKERLGYPTQKPTALLKRIIAASSNDGDIVFDPFCGCGTTIHACEELGRGWVGCDIAMPAIKLIQDALHEKHVLEAGRQYILDGIPVTGDQAEVLFRASPRSFQTWIVESVKGLPCTKHSRDRGIDGWIWFHDTDEGKGDLKSMILSVKGGNTGPAHIRELKGTLEREERAGTAKMAGFLCIQKPTKEMSREAATAGMYECCGERFPRIQILTAHEILDQGRVFDTPRRVRLAKTNHDRGYRILSGLGED